MENHSLPPLSRNLRAFTEQSAYPFGGEIKLALSRVSMPYRFWVPESFRGGCSFGDNLAIILSRYSVESIDP